MITPVLLCGGVGSRLWPVSREAFPKQFLPLAGEQSMLLDTIDRLGESGPPIVLCNDEHRFLVAEQLRDKPKPRAIILEPEGRNTAPALTVAALCAAQDDENALLLVLPADHLIEDEEAFREAVERGVDYAQSGKLVTFGIVPDSAHTGYGYIARGEALDQQVPAHRIGEFVEKPNADVAQEYLDSGSYYWNSGMFLASAKTWLQELAAHAPDIFEACQAAWSGASLDLDFCRLDAAAFGQCRSDSIDYAVMEHTDAGVVLGLDCGWSDVGAWSALWEKGAKDTSNNVILGDVLTEDVEGSYLRADQRLLAAVGVKDLVVVETADAVLVADRNKVQDVKAIVNQLKQQSRTESALHSKVYRPWGSYESLVSAERFQVKRIIVNPGQKLSLQMHHHRAEHWIIVAGTAVVTCGDKEFSLTEDQSTYIPLGHKHRLANPGRIPLELIEVQSGSYLGEDDIVRFEDVYGRSETTSNEGKS